MSEWVNERMGQRSAEKIAHSLIAHLKMEAQMSELAGEKRRAGSKFAGLVGRNPCDSMLRTQISAIGQGRPQILITMYFSHIFFGLLAITWGFSCKNPMCDLHEFSSQVRDIEFSKDVWMSSGVAVDTYEAFLQRDLKREEMICDLVNNHLFLGCPKERVISILGSPDSSRGTIALKIITDKKIYEDTVDSLYYQPEHLPTHSQLIYRCGYNASGSCFVFFVFKNNQYIGCYRGFAL